MKEKGEEEEKERGWSEGGRETRKKRKGGTEKMKREKQKRWVVCGVLLTFSTRKRALSASC